MRLVQNGRSLLHGDCNKYFVLQQGSVIEATLEVFKIRKSINEDVWTVDTIWCEKEVNRSTNVYTNPTSKGKRKETPVRQTRRRHKQTYTRSTYK